MTAPPANPSIIDSAINRVATMALYAVIAAVAAPCLVIALPTALIIEKRSTRQWPLVLAGAALTASAGVFVGPTGLLRGSFALLSCLRGGHRPSAATLFGYLPGVVGTGLLLAPALPRWYRELILPEHERGRHRAEQQRRRAEHEAARIVSPLPPDRTVLGVALGDGHTEWTIRHRGHPLVAPPLELWGRHALVIGETGSGKTVTSLTIAAEALRLGHHVYWIDGKADPDTAEAFLSHATHAGVAARNGLLDPIDGWRGGADAVINRLLATQHFSEPYYEGVTRAILQESIDDSTRSMTDLVRRLAEPIVRKSRPSIARDLPARERLGVRARYEGIAWAVGNHLDGTWSYEDTPAAYLPVGRPENRNQAAEVGAFILEDLLHWALARKPREQHALVIVDEFSRLSDRPDAAVDLIERARSNHVGVILIAQSWDSLGPNRTTRNRLAATVGTIICHQTKQPEPIAALAGTRAAIEQTRQTRDGHATGFGSQRIGNRFTVHPDDLRRLRPGEAHLIGSGTATALRVRRPGGPPRRR